MEKTYRREGFLTLLKAERHYKAARNATDHGGGMRRSSMFGSGGLHNPHAARSTLTTLNRGSRSTWMFKAKPSGQAVSARRSVTVFAVTAIPVSTSTLILSR